MKFGVIGSITKPTTFEAMRGTEVLTALFLLESAKRGHICDLYALHDSLSIPDKIRLISISAHGIDAIRNIDSFQEKHPRECDISSLMGIFFSRINIHLKEQEDQYDIVINSAGCSFFPFNWHMYSP